jgi:hypothetical protein
MGSTSDKAFVTPTFQRWQEQATDPRSERNPPYVRYLPGTIDEQISM